MDHTLPRLTVIGTGYLGATHAICMAVLGYEVLGVDVDPDKIERLGSGEVPFFEPGLPELLTKALESGRLRFTTSYEEAGAFGDVHFVCVGTPQKKGEFAADMTYVDAPENRPIRVYETVDTRFILEDFFAKLQAFHRSRTG